MRRVASRAERREDLSQRPADRELQILDRSPKSASVSRSRLLREKLMAWLMPQALRLRRAMVPALRSDPPASVLF
jgi:hypothetical protein